MKTPPIVVNAFPKSGTHLLAQMLAPLAEPNPVLVGADKDTRYLATHDNGGWGPGYRSENVVLRDLKLLEPGQYAGAHLAAYLSVMDFLETSGWPVLFLYRDLRDVAISETYHIERQHEWAKHPFKEAINKLPTHEDRLKAVIIGYGRHKPLRERWEEYAPWLTSKLVLPISFREARLRPRQTAAAILGYIHWRTEVLYDEEAIEHMVGSISPKGSPTFRAGRVGDHLLEFDCELREIAEAELGAWCEALGFNEPIEREETHEQEKQS